MYAPAAERLRTRECRAGLPPVCTRLCGTRRKEGRLAFDIHRASRAGGYAGCAARKRCTSAFSGITRSAPRRVITMAAAAFANVSIS